MKSVLMNYSDYTDYTSELCHMLKRMGDFCFANSILDYVDLDVLLLSGRKKHALYTVAMIDHVSKENHFPIKAELARYRCMKMESLSFSSGIETYTRITHREDMKKHALQTAMKEFLVYNIVESSIRDVS